MSDGIHIQVEDEETEAKPQTKSAQVIIKELSEKFPGRKQQITTLVHLFGAVSNKELCSI